MNRSHRLVSCTPLLSHVYTLQQCEGHIQTLTCFQVKRRNDKKDFEGVAHHQPKSLASMPDRKAGQIDGSPSLTLTSRQWKVCYHVSGYNKSSISSLLLAGVLKLLCKYQLVSVVSRNAEYNVRPLLTLGSPPLSGARHQQAVSTGRGDLQSFGWLWKPINKMNHNHCSKSISCSWDQIYVGQILR